jgi:hypothetical protein
MQVQIKVCLNSDEIQEAIKRNAYYKQQRESNLKRPKKEKVLVPDDVEIPEQQVELSTVLLDSKDIQEARKNEIGMISIIHLGQPKMICYSDEVWARLEKRFMEV